MTLPRLLAACLLGAAFAAAATPAHADRDAVHFGSNIQIAPDSTVHDAVCFFCSVDAKGEVKGDVVVIFGNVHVAGKADRDVVNLFGKVSVDDNAQVGRDLVNIFGFIQLGENASVGHDMVDIFGDVNAPESARVGHDRVGIPACILFIPLVFVGLVVILIVSAVRSYRRRRYYGAYPWPPQL
jgi:hypothetical protein